MLMITPAERYALQLWAEGGSRTELAASLDVPERELDRQLTTLCARMGVRTQLEAVAECVKRGLSHQSITESDSSEPKGNQPLAEL